ncbi:MAG: putative sulfate exporter family transporter [Chloroflexi bacterium]|nr:putative sulfate exporter family transporter [Chloroflexota bacterium]
MSVAQKPAAQERSVSIARYLPGLALSAGIALLSWGVQLVEEQTLGQAIIEAIVVAILLGMALRTFWKPDARWMPGIAFSAKEILEVAIVLLGASISLPVLLKAGIPLVLAIVLVVMVGIAASMTIGRILGLNPKLAILVACGNSICGNSAIAAMAPVIGAEAQDVASSIALTAVVGVVLVLGLPLLIPVLNFSFYQYGVLAGMTVYAVPQVLAATFPVSTLSGQVGTLVKLVRVLMLGPVVLFFALRFRRPEPAGRLSISRLVPWFIVGFIVLASARSIGLLPVEIADPLRETSRWLTVVAMAALGLGVDVRVVRKVGRPIAMAVSGSLIVLIIVSTALILGLGIQ